MKKKTFHSIIQHETSKLFKEMSAMAGGAVEGLPVKKKKKELDESGNAIPGAVPVTKQNFNVIMKQLKKILKGIDFQPIGSGGQKETSGDVDVILDLNQAKELFKVPDPKNKTQQKALGKNVRIELEKLFQQSGYQTNRTGISVHVGIPVDKSGNVAQVDLMVVPNAMEVAPLHQHDYSEDPNMKGGTIHGLIGDITRATPPPPGESVPEGEKSYYKLSPYVGLMTRSPSQLVTSNKDEIAKIIIGPQATAKDLGSVRNILRALKKYSPEKYDIVMSDEKLKTKLAKDIESLQETLKEAKVGREYQHLEDLLIIDGSQGGLEAIELLEQIGAKPQVVDFKWDGGASVFWGRDNKGNFVFAPKNQWNKGLALDKEGLASEIENTGRMRKGEDPEAFKAGRKQLADKYRKIFSIFEAATPKNFRGWLNGDIMFESKQLQDENGNYVFTPNKVTYTVSEDGLFGKMPTAEVFVVVHGIVPAAFGADVSANLKPIKKDAVMAFNRTPELIVLPTQKPKMKPLDTSGLDKVKNNISANSKAIDLVSNFKAPRFSNFKGILYTYAVAKAKTGIGFMDWLEGSKLSQNQKNTTISFVTENAQAFEAFWKVFDQVVAVKVSVLNKIFSGHGQNMQNELGISASIGDTPGGEGLVVNRKGGGFGKLINPAFRSGAVNQKFAESINEGPATDKIVISWGRGMGHKGHMALARATFKYAERIGAEPVVLLSRSFGKKDPLPVEMKLGIYHKVFPERQKNIIIAPKKTPSIFQFLGKLKDMGHFQDITIIVGADQLENFKKIEINNDKAGHFKKLKVLSRQQAVGKDDPDFGFEGPRATNMRNILKDPEASEQEQFKVWKDSMPDELSDEDVKELINIARQNMGLLEDINMKRNNFINEQKLREHIREAIKISYKKKQKALKEEQELRAIIRMLIEGEKPEASPHASTGINVLEDLLKKIVPVIEQDYKQLTTEPGQRESFRAHIVNAVQNVLAPEAAIADASPPGAMNEDDRKRLRDPEDMVSHFARNWTKTSIRSSMEPKVAFYVRKLGDGSYAISKMITKVEPEENRRLSKDDAIKFLDKELYRRWYIEFDDSVAKEPDRRSIPRDDSPERRAMREDVGLSVGDEKPKDDDKFIDIEGDKAEIPTADPRDDFGIDDEEVTGRNFAFNTFGKIENQIVDSYAMLDNATDRTLFFDYLITNLKLYFDKFEDELRANIGEPSTDEYEKQSQQKFDKPEF